MRKSNNTTSTVMAYLKNGSPLSWTGTPDNTTGMREVTGPGYTARWNNSTMADRTHWVVTRFVKSTPGSAGQVIW